MQISNTSQITNVKLKKAINGLIFSQSFFSCILLQQKIVRDYAPRTKTFSVDGKCLRYNDDFVNSLSHEEILGVLCHEILHLILLHHARMGKREHELSNIAMDLAINPELLNAGFKLPKGCLNEKRFHNMSYENIYRVLLKEREDERQKEQDKQKTYKKDIQNEPNEMGDSGDKSDKGEKADQLSDKDDSTDEDQVDEPGEKEENEEESDKGDESDEEADSSDNNDEESDKDNDEGESQDESNSEDKHNGKQSSDEPTNKGESNEEKDNGEQTFGEVIPCSEEDEQEMEESMKVAIKQALAVSKACGQLPCKSLVDIIEEALKTQYDWKEILSTFLSEICATDYSFSRANPRHLGRNIILPSLYNKTYGKLVIVCDVSGSLVGEISIFAAEIASLFDMMCDGNPHAGISIIYCDSEVNGIQEFISGDEVKLQIHGGGGTNFAPPFKYIEENMGGEKIEGIFYLTDGYNSDQYELDKITPVAETYWFMTCDNNQFNPKFGTKVRFLNI